MNEDVENNEINKKKGSKWGGTISLYLFWESEIGGGDAMH